MKTIFLFIVIFIKKKNDIILKDYAIISKCVFLIGSRSEELLKHTLKSDDLMASLRRSFLFYFVKYVFIWVCISLS